MDSQIRKDSLPMADTILDQDVQHLFRAIRKGKTHLTKFMLAASNNSLLNCLSSEGRTPLIECCFIREELTRGHMVRILKDAGADVNLKDGNGKTPLIHACEQRCNDVVKILIQHANICPDVEDADGNTALIHSAYTGNDVALELLVKNFRRLGLNIDHYNKAGYTALHTATTKGFIQCAKILTLKGKASVTLKDKVHRLTPLEWCLRMGFQKSEVEFLKPAAKFYKVAKLTTTMVKCRKKSDQDLPVSQLSPRKSPTRITEKPKFKVRNLLNKTKMNSSEETGPGTVCKHVSQPTKVKTNEKNVMSKFIAKSKSNFLSKSKYKHILGKSRQRSLSHSDQPEEVQAAANAVTGLTHSRSHPVTTVCLQAITSECISEGETSQENLQEFIILPGDYADCDTDDLDSCKLDIDSDYLSTVIHQKTIYYRHDKAYCGETESCSSATNTISGVNYEEGGLYSGTSSSNSKGSPAGYCRHGRDPPANSRGLYASGESSYSEQSIRSCTESIPSSLSSFSGKEESDVSDTSGDDSSYDSSDETHSTVIDKNPYQNQGKLSSSKQLKHSSKSKQNVNKHLKQKTDISHATKRPISDTSFDGVSHQTEIDYLDDACSPAHPQDVSRHMEFSHSGRNTVYFSESKEFNNSSNRQSLFTQRIVESPSMGRNLISPQTEIEYIHHEDSSQSLDFPECSRGEMQNSAQQSHSNTTENAQSTKIENDNDKIWNDKTGDRAKNVQESAILERECINKHVGTTRKEFSSPQTDIIYIDLRTPDNMPEDTRFEYLKTTNGHERTKPETKTDQKCIPSTGQFVNKIKYARTTRQDIVSPETEIEYIDMRTPDNTTENNILEIHDDQKGHYVSETKTKRTQNVILSRDTFNREIKHIRTTQISPQTEIESLEETNDYLNDDNDDDISDDVTDVSHPQFTVRKSLHDFQENVMQLVDQATSQGFVVESKHVRKRTIDTEDVDQSSCEEQSSCASSGAETLIVNLENELSYLSVDSLFPSMNGENIDVEKEGNETC